MATSAIKKLGVVRVNMEAKHFGFLDRLRLYNVCL